MIKREYRAATLVLCSCVLGVVAMRIIMYFVPLPSDTYGQSLISDVAFTLPTQLLFFLIIPFCIYKFYGKRTLKQTLEFSSAGKFESYYLLAIPLGIVVFFITIAVSSVWTMFLSMTGYTVTNNVTPKPNDFVAGYMIADIALTAILPAVCEEFAMRGGLLSTVKKSFTARGCVLFGAVVFGLFHQNIRQVFYTSLFGGLAMFITLSTGSIYPAMLMHFFNNFCSVFFDYATDYGWAFGGGLYNAIDAMSPLALGVAFIVALAVAVLLVISILYFCVYRRSREIYKLKAAADETDDPADKARFERTAVAMLGGEPKTKPRAADTVGMIALGVVAALTTIFTYVWGFLY